MNEQPPAASQPISTGPTPYPTSGGEGPESRPSSSTSSTDSDAPHSHQDTQATGSTPQPAISSAAPQGSPTQGQQQPQAAKPVQSTTEAGNVPAVAQQPPRPIETFRPVVQAVRGGNGRFESLKPAEPPKATPIALLNSPNTAQANDLENQATAKGGIKGLDAIPKGWPELPGSVSLSQEIAWVQSERLRVVEDKGGVIRVNLSKAKTSAPSMSALSWLETSIRSYAKFIEVAAKQASAGDDQAEFIRRERMQLGEIRAILQEMMPSSKS